MTWTRANSSRQDADCCGQNGRAPLPDRELAHHFPAAANPNAPVTNVAVPKPVAQSSFRLLSGSGSAAHVPFAHGYTGSSDENTHDTPKSARTPRGKPHSRRSFRRTWRSSSSCTLCARSLTRTAVPSRLPPAPPIVSTGIARSRQAVMITHLFASRSVASMTNE